MSLHQFLSMWFCRFAWQFPHGQLWELSLLCHPLICLTPFGIFERFGKSPGSWTKGTGFCRRERLCALSWLVCLVCWWFQIVLDRKCYQLSLFASRSGCFELMVGPRISIPLKGFLKVVERLQSQLKAKFIKAQSSRVIFEASYR